MKKGARPSQIINNFFTFGTIVMISIVITLYSKYFGQNQNEPLPLPSKLKVLACFDENSKVRFTNSTLLQEASKALSKGFYKIDGGYIKSLNAKSYIQEYISLDELDSFFIESIKTAKAKNPAKYITIKYEVIENDKNDTTLEEKKKFNFGALQTSIRLNGKEILWVFTDFRFFDKIELRKITDCTIRTLKANAN